MMSGDSKELRSATMAADGDSKPAALEKIVTAAGDTSGASSPLDQLNDCNNSTFKVNLSMDRNICATAYGTEDGVLTNEAENHIKAANELPIYSDSEEEYHYEGGKQCANPGMDPSHIYAEPPLLIQRGKLTYDQCMVNVAIFSSLAEDTLKQREGRICWGCKSSEHRFFQCPSKNDPMVQARGVAGYRALLALPPEALLAVPPEKKTKKFIYHISRKPTPPSSPDSDVAGYRALLAVPPPEALLAVPPEKKPKKFIYHISRKPTPPSSPDSSTP